MLEIILKVEAAQKAVHSMNNKAIKKKQHLLLS